MRKGMKVKGNGISRNLSFHGQSGKKVRNIMHILKRCNYTIDELAEELNVPYMAIYAWVSYDEQPEMELVDMTSEYLGLEKKFFLLPWAEVKEEFYGLPMYLYRLDDETEWYRFKSKDEKDRKYYMAKDYYPKQDYLQEKMKFYESAIRRYIGVIESSQGPLKYSDKEIQYRRGREFLNICTNIYKACFQLDPKERMDYYEATKMILKNLTETLQGRRADDNLAKALEMLVDAIKEDDTEEDVDLDDLLLSGQTKCVMKSGDNN